MNKANFFLECLKNFILESRVISAETPKQAFRVFSANRDKFKLAHRKRDVEDLMHGRQTTQVRFDTDEANYTFILGTYSERPGMFASGSIPTAILGAIIVLKIQDKKGGYTTFPHNATLYVIKNPPPVPSDLMGYHKFGGW